ncbi:hypothetical protein OROHE_026558 [Orobanche hederae]
MDIIKLNRLQGKRMPESAPMKSRRISVKPEPPDPMPEALVSTTSVENAGSRKMDEMNNTDKEVIIKSEIKLEHENNETTSNLELRETERKIAEIVKPADEILDMEIEKQKIGASIKIRKARTYNHAIDKNVLLPTKPLVKIEKETSIITEITEAVEDQGVEMNDSLRLVLFNHRTKHSTRAKMNLGRKTQAQQRNGIGTLKINHAKPISSLNTEGRRPRKKCKAEEIHIKSSSGEKITENETQLAFSGIKIDGGPKADVSLISSKQNKSNSCFGYQIVEKKMKKPLKMEHDPLVGMAEEGDIRTKLVLHDPLVGMAEEAGIRTKLVLRIKDVDRLTLADLRIMAKNQKLPRYYRLRKKELLERLGLEGPMQKANEKKGVPISPANTI